MPDLNFDKLIYLDSEFVSRKYEELTGKNPNTNFAKTQGGEAGVGAFGFKGGVHTQETRSFSISSRKMLTDIWEKLNSRYKQFEEKKFQNYRGTEMAWLSGGLSISEWRKSGSNNSKDSYEYFDLKHNDKKTAFLTHREYFAAGFDELFDACAPLKGNIDIPVYCLVRVLWHVEITNHFTAYPYIIIEDKKLNSK